VADLTEWPGDELDGHRISGQFLRPDAVADWR
jgi:hypothetical protein